MTATASTAVIRQWARSQGLPVGDRGRLSPMVLNAYTASNSSTLASVSTEQSAGPRRQTPPPAARIAARPTRGATGIALKVAARQA